MIYKSTLNAITGPELTVEADGFIPLAQNTVLTGQNIEHIAGSTEVDLLAPGIYYVSFSVDALPSSQVLTTFQLYNNGVPVAGANACFTGQANITNTAAFTTLVKVLPSCCAVDNTGRLQIGVDVKSIVGNIDLVVFKVA